MAGVTWRLTYEAALGNLDPTFTPSHTPKLGEKKDGGGGRGEALWLLIYRKGVLPPTSALHLKHQP